MSKSMLWMTLILGIYVDTLTDFTNLEVFGFVSMGMLIAIACRVVLESPIKRKGE